ncbi:Ornithine cyclodeaminase OS=uncultured planctomycete GN=HGMM_F11G08C23 PE=4 SV=1: OCD_Mu_crystall [Gemmataceae bacterium]|nr:Ornithine cyclodeaminase OS=uncultured planctomycete GN=HGMM_F11G08C23 PE=4 SV=1: OCD_Mu_crystall [Gemmataceae bacterium]VTT98337.1 Ornithine cyclodeaminase OS=uncultured planctomycete GN=HGMM_F11G08C23 PE=4 SV=1: OCD_Mu_crystall [Gemmataceae bacterium]
MPVLFLTEAEVASVLTMDLALDAVGAAFRKLALDEAVNVPRQRCQTDLAMLHVLPAAAKTLGVLGFKAYTTTKAGAKFHVTLYDGKTGAMTAVVEADLIGQFRTGAASGVATKKLARSGAATVGCLGTGKQARTQVLAVCKSLPVTRVAVHGRDPARRAEFAAALARETGVEVVPVEFAEAAVRGLDVVITATSSRDPVLRGEWVGAGQHLNLIGSNFLTKAEADAEVFRKATVVTVDSKEQAKHEAGDFVTALNEGVLRWSDVREVSAVLIGRTPGRTSPDDVTVFKSLGLGIEDIALAARVADLARQRGLGREIL